MTSFIKKKTSDKKFYGYTGPVKPELKKSKYIAKKATKEAEKDSNTSYGYSGKPREVKKKVVNTWITKNKNKN